MPGSRREVLAIVCPYLMAVTTYWMWWAGRPAPPARFAAAILPALAPALAMAWTGGDRSTRKGLLALLGASLAITVLLLGVNRGALAWNDRDAEAHWLDWLGPVVNLPRGWPSFFWKLDVAGAGPKFTSEIWFVLHVGLWLAIFIGGWIAVQRIGRRREWADDTWRVGTGVWLLAASMAATQSGWWLNAVDGLDPARSQMALLSHGPHAWQVSAFNLRRVVLPLDARVTIREEEPGRTDAPAPWLRLSAVPPGRYVLQVITSGPRSGELRVRIGRSPRPFRTFDVRPLNRQSFDLVLPAGADVLTIEQDSAMSAVGGHLVLEPQEWEQSPPRLALSTMRYGSVDAFFMDDHVFAEDTGFWVHGEQRTSVVLANAPTTNAAGPPARMLLRNGAVPNLVTVDQDVSHIGRTLHSTAQLAPQEERAIDLLHGGPRDIVRVQIQSAAGFRPADSGPTGDTRYLGVWVEVR